jgi:hypothetical protein
MQAALFFVRFCDNTGIELEKEWKWAVFAGIGGR